MMRDTHDGITQVGTLKGDYSAMRREPTVFFNVLLLDAMTASMMTWVRRCAHCF